MKSIFILIALLLFTPNFLFASDLVSKKSPMSKEEFLRTFPKSLNKSVQSSTQFKYSAGPFLVGAKRDGDTIIMMHEYDYRQLINKIKTTLLMSEINAKQYLKSDEFKKTLFNNKTERNNMLNQYCTQPNMRRLLNEGVKINYTFFLSTGEHLGDIEITKNMCNK